MVLLNDNGRSYAPTTGGVAAHLERLRRGDRGGGDLFGALGLAYIGPGDGHDPAALDAALAQARACARTVVVHCVTRKGLGYPPAEADQADQADQMHTVPVSDPATGRSSGPLARSWTNVFSDELLELATERADLVAVSAAMTGPTGLAALGRVFPDRVVDVGIAEQHAVTAAGRGTHRRALLDGVADAAQRRGAHRQDVDHCRELPDGAVPDVRCRCHVRRHSSRRRTGPGAWCGPGTRR